MSNPNSKQYKDKLKALRGLVDFDYDLRKPLHPRQKGKINKYYKELQEAKGQPYRIYRPRNKNKLRAVQEAAGMQLKDFKVAVIPNLDPENPTKVKIKNNKVIFSGKYSDRIFRKFNQINLIENTEKEIERILNQMQGDKISIACGKFEFGSGRYFSSHESVKEKTLQLINQYSSDKNANNYFQNWLHGLYDISIKNQERLDDTRRFAAIYKATPKRQREKLLRNGKNGKKKNSRG